MHDDEVVLLGWGEELDLVGGEAVAFFVEGGEAVVYYQGFV